MIIARHAESEFNAIYGPTRKDPGIVDPPLTERGRTQAAALAAALAAADINRIIASPYSRALETAAIVARALGCPVDVDPGVRERRAWTCDIGRPTSELRAAWPGVGFPPMAERWWPEREEPSDSVARRGAAFHARMRPDPAHVRTLVISHWGFIRALTGHELTNATWLRLRLGSVVEVVTTGHP